MANILITGASGFIGSFLVEEALSRGFTTWAGMRASSSKRYIKNPDINFLVLDFAHPDKLKEQLSAHQSAHGNFDYIVHCAGATKCRNKQEFEQTNFLQTKYFVDTLMELNMTPKQFLYISTLSVYGPIREADYTPILESDIPQPNTAYGLSKLKSEQYLQGLQDFPYVIFRPTGVYGPREADYYLMAKSIGNHLDFSVGYRRQDLTFVYVKDIVQAVFAAIDKQVLRRAYFLSDGAVYPSRQFSDLIQKEMAQKTVIRIKCPLIVLKIVSLLAEMGTGITGKPSTLNSDKYKIMKQRNWQCDISPAQQELGYAPQSNLERGVKETIAWYKREGWL